MLLYHLFQVLLLFGAFALAADKPADNLEQIWEIDQSCDSHIPEIKKAYSDSVLMVRSAVSDLEQLSKTPPPRNLRSNVKDYAEYARAKRLIYFIFGIKIGHEDQAEDNYPEAVKKVFDAMNEAFTNGHPVPRNGHSGKVKKPLLLCGDQMWKWLDLKDADPTDPAHRPISESRKKELDKAGDRFRGALSYKDRLVLRPKETASCQPGYRGTTLVAHDVVTLCDLVFEAPFAEAKSIVDREPEIQPNDNTKLYDFENTLSLTLIHEFVHYYGGPGDGAALGALIGDIQGVSRNGDLVWKDSNGKPTLTDTGTEYAAYGMYRVITLAREHEDNDDSGPNIATQNADSFAYYAVAAYLNKWEWPTNGKAEALPDNPGELDEPWNKQPPTV